MRPQRRQSVAPTLGRAFTAKTADALVAAWLPGTEAEGITDVLLGEYDFSGKLPHSWPRSLDQVPINVGDAHYDPLFPYGFGLSYGDPRKVDHL